MQKTEKLKRLKDIGAISKEKEETFRSQYNRFFVDSYDEGRLLEILDKFTIEDAKTSIDGISDEFSKYVGHIPSENRDGYIGALLGEILIKVKEPPHKWEVTKSAFYKILQVQSTAYSTQIIFLYLMGNHSAMIFLHLFQNLKYFRILLL